MNSKNINAKGVIAGAFVTGLSAMGGSVASAQEVAAPTPASSAAPVAAAPVAPTTVTPTAPVAPVAPAAPVQDLGTPVGAPEVTAVPTPELDQAVTEAKDAGVQVNEAPAVSVPSDEKAAEVIDGQVEKVTAVKDTAVAVNKAQDVITDKAAAGGVLINNDPAVVYHNDNTGALADIQNQEALVDSAVAAQDQINKVLPGAIDSADKAGVKITNTADVTYNDATKALADLSAQVAQLQKAESTQANLDASLALAIAEAKKAGINVTTSQDVVYTDFNKAISDVRSQVGALLNAAVIRNQANGIISDATKAAEANGTVIETGKTVTVSADEAIAKANEIAASVTQISSTSKAAMDKYLADKAALDAKNADIAKANADAKAKYDAAMAEYKAAVAAGSTTAGTPIPMPTNVTKVGTVNGKDVVKSPTSDMTSADFQKIVDSFSSGMTARYLASDLGWQGNTQLKDGVALGTLNTSIPYFLKADGFTKSDLGKNMRVGDVVTIQNVGSVTDTETGQKIPVNATVKLNDYTAGAGSFDEGQVSMFIRNEGGTITIGWAVTSGGIYTGGTGQTEQGGTGGSNAGGANGSIGYINAVDYTVELVDASTGKPIEEGNTAMIIKASDIDASQKATLDSNGVMGYVVSPDTGLEIDGSGLTSKSSAAVNADSTKLISTSYVTVKKDNSAKINYTYTDGAQNHFDIVTAIFGNTGLKLNPGKPLVDPEPPVYKPAIPDTLQKPGVSTAVVDRLLVAAPTHSVDLAVSAHNIKMSANIHDIDLVTEFSPVNLVEAHPLKHIYTQDGQRVDGKTLLPNSEVSYVAVFDLDQYKGMKADDKNINDLVFFDDLQDSTVDINVSKITNTLADGTAVKGLVPTEYKSLSEAPEFIQALAKKNNIQLNGKFIAWVPTDSKSFYDEYVTKGLNIYHTMPVVLGDYVGTFDNHVSQVVFGQFADGNTVENNIPKLEAIKDVVKSVGSDESINHGTVAFGQSFPYELNGPAVKANIAGGLHEYRTVDNIDETHDEYNGEFYAFAEQDITLKDGTVIKAGDEITRYYTQHLTRNENGVVSEVEYIVDPAFLGSIAEDSVFDPTIYMVVKRIAYGENIENIFDVYVNGYKITSNKVYTNTYPPKETPKETPVVPTAVTPKAPEDAPVAPAAVLPETGDNCSVLGAVAGVGFVSAASMMYKARRKR